MATYYLYSAAAGAANGSSWTDAYTTLQAVIAVSTSADTILVAHDHDQSGGTLLITFPTTPGLKVICVNRSTGNLATTAFVRAGATASAFGLDGFGYVYGITFVGGTSSSASASLGVGMTANVILAMTLEDCGFELPNANANVTIWFGGPRSTTMTHVAATLVRPRFKFANAGHKVIFISGVHEITGATIDAAGTTPTTIFGGGAGVGGTISVVASDLSSVSWTNLVATSTSSGPQMFRFHQCKFPSGWIAVTGSLANGPGSTHVLITECGSGDQQYDYAYHNPLGSVTLDTTIKLTASEAGASWKIVTNSNCKPGFAFVTPWLPGYMAAGAGAVRYVEVLRDGSATAFNNDAVYADFMVKEDSGFTNGSFSTTRPSLIATPAAIATGAGLGSWSGESGTAWSGKLESGTLTPAEAGDMSFRIGVTAAVTVYVDPVLRT